VADESDHRAYRPPEPCSSGRAEHPSAQSRPSATYVAVFSSYLIGECDQRAFVLKAVGIEHFVAQNVNRFVLLVPEAFAEAALEHLRHYDEESKPKPRPAPIQLHRHAWIGSVLYAIVMLGIAYAAGAHLGGYDWYEAGVLRRTAIADGELWRIVTALTLHADVGHILGNLAFGIPYGYFTAQLLGIGRAWASILVAAAIANLFDAALMSSQQASLGASTAVFAMLGIVGAYAWQRGQSRFNRWAHRLAPLIAAVALLGVTGAGGENTDIVAHLAGFAAGAGTGVLQAHLRFAWLDRLTTQTVLGIATILVFGAAWAAALAA
jgi:membrane associated rhomboid family serine protease